VEARWPQLRFTIFLVALLVLLFVALPARAAGGGGAVVSKIALTLTVFCGLYAVGLHRGGLLLAVVPVVPLLVLTWTGLDDASEWGVAASRALGAAFLLVAAGAIASDVMRARSVSTDTIAGGICVYVLLGAIWTYVYMALNVVDSGAFFLGASGGAERGAIDSDLVYFSFVTLSTLGYGDVLPVSGAARAMATLEALTGQIYITVFIARLVGLHISRRE
jgi:hypothetical protein